MASGQTKLLVAAIDFGTTFSGYAFSFRHQYETDPIKVTGKTWQSTLATMKAPTCILLRPDQTFEAFGYEAENIYCDHAVNNEHHQWYFFKRFKMMLHDRMGMKRGVELEDQTGKSLPAVTVFSLAIKFLKDDLMKSCKDKLTEIYEKDIHWVLTTPAIWTDAAKQFMREAAVKAGIAEDRLEIALEPEAASIYCRHIPLKRSDEDGQTSAETFTPGLQYLVLDAGGGTIDITVHEVTRDRSVRELHHATGGPWGGTKVDEEFRQMLISILGSPIFKTFQEESMDDYLELFRDFESKKRGITPDSSAKQTFRVPVSLKELFEEKTGEKIQDAISHMNIKNKVKWFKDKLQIEADLMRKFFTKAVKETVDHVDKLLQEKELRSVSTILMVGGFSESPILQEAVKNKFSQIKVLVPPEAGSAVLKGAVIYGHNPRAILERKCKYTYGIKTTSVFDPEKHDEKHKTKKGGKERCDNIFSKHVQIGQTVKVGEFQEERVYRPIYENQTGMDFPVFASTKPNSTYVTDECCIELGKLTIDIPDFTGDGKDREVKVKMCYGGTELQVRAHDITSGNTVTGKFDFLG